MSVNTLWLAVWFLTLGSTVVCRSFVEARRDVLVPSLLTLEAFMLVSFGLAFHVPYVAVAQLVGLGLNSVAVGLNGWKMPVRSDEFMKETLMHCRMTEETRVKWLCDIVPCGLGVLSVGDLIILLSIPLAVVYLP